MKKKNEIHESIRWRHTLRWRLTLFVLLILIMSGITTVMAVILMITVFQKAPPVVVLTLNPIIFVTVMICFCAVVGTVLSGFLGTYYLRPLKQLREATKRVKNGDYKVQVRSSANPESEMGELVASFNEMVRELDGTELFRNDFINNFSHEFKTPIVSIRGFARELQHSDLDPAQRQEYAKIIADEADRLAKLSINVLELSKLENQQIVSEKKLFSLDEQIRQCILLQEGEWSKKEIEIVPELCEVEFFSNEELLAHIWVNLIGNAIKFTPEGGSVFVTLTQDDKCVTVQIRDTGIGMSEEVKQRIFEKFYQGDPSHEKKGYGIGLTMAKRAITLCNGSITVESTPQKGSTFTVTLPKSA